MQSYIDYGLICEVTMNIVNRQDAFNNEADIITHIETINSIARKKSSDYLKKHQVNYQQWRILKSIHLESAVTPAKVSTTTFTDSGTISRQLELLEARGLVSREKSKHDRRVVNLKLSSKGVHIANDGMNFICALLDTVKYEIGNQKINELNKTLEAIVKSSTFQLNTTSL